MKHCSNCGERIVGEQQFCRSCGVELIEVQKQKLGPRTLMFIGLFGAIASALVVLFGGFLGSNTIAVIGFALVLLSFGVMATGGILAEHPRRRRKTAAPSADTQNQPPALEKADTTNRLPSIPADDHFPASVTEETTAKLRLE